MTFWAAGATVVSALIGSSGASSAADAQVAGSQEQARVQKEIFDKQVELQEPARQAGIAGRNELLRLLGLAGDKTSAGYGSMAQPFTGQDMYKDPGYAFRVNESLKALDRSAAARGGLLGGNQLRGVTELGQNLASQEYMNAFNRYQAERAARLNPLQSLFGAGQSAATALTGAAGNLGTALGQSAENIGAARASGYVGRANAINNALGQITNYYTGQQAMDRIFGPRQPAIGTGLGVAGAYGAGGFGD